MKASVVFKNVTKKYRIGDKYQPSLKDWFWAILTGKPFSGTDFKALDNISFKVARGKVLGIVGSNGSGKSTVLKLISKITYPNEGKVEINGSVAGLLELGTGFHLSLTGKENVYIYGAILGLRKNDIDTIYDSVVEFSGLGKFMDTPVKHYSSGMLARLGFSVSIHLKPDILLIDEVLAVGDLAFQEKCIRFMKDYCKDPNRTVIFISHSTANVVDLCDEVIWLEKGAIRMQGDKKKILKEYIKYQRLKK